MNGQLTCHYQYLFRTAGLSFHQSFKCCHKHKCFVFSCSDQAKADLKADDDGEIGEGQETARAKEVWQKGWCLFFTSVIIV